MNITKWKQLLVSLVVLALAATCFVPMSKAEAAGNDPIDVNASAAIMIEASSGKILYSKNADKRLPIASMTKMMTEYLLLEAIKEGKVKWDQTYTPDDYVYEISQDNSLSNVPLRKDGKYTVKELYQAMAIYSANGAAIAVAEILAGSEFRLSNACCFENFRIISDQAVCKKRHVFSRNFTFFFNAFSLRLLAVKVFIHKPCGIFKIIVCHT